MDGFCLPLDYTIQLYPLMGIYGLDEKAAAVSSEQLRKAVDIPSTLHMLATAVHSRNCTLNDQPDAPFSKTQADSTYRPYFRHVFLPKVSRFTSIDLIPLQRILNFQPRKWRTLLNYVLLIQRPNFTQMVSCIQTG